VRFLRTVRVRVAERRRDDYLAVMAEVAAAARGEPRILGFYLVESAERPGDFREYWEFADEATAEAFDAETGDPALARAARRRREIVRPDAESSGGWHQRL
jgi:quinol monooxygenase YgiN